MAVVPYVRATHVDGQPWSAAKANVLEAGVNDVSYAPCVRVFHNAAQAATTGVTLTLAFNSERYDQAGGTTDTQHDTVTNNSRLTCRYAGVYEIKGNIEFAANATGQRILNIRHSASGAVIASIDAGNQGAGNTVSLAVSCHYLLAVNEFVTLEAFQDSGGNLNVNSTGNFSPEFSMVRVA